MDWNSKDILNRVESEYDDLEANTNRLTMFIADRANFNNLSDDMRFLLLLQRDLMRGYLSVLRKRLDIMDR